MSSFGPALDLIITSTTVQGQRLIDRRIGAVAALTGDEVIPTVEVHGDRVDVVIALGEIGIGITWERVHVDQSAELVDRVAATTGFISKDEVRRRINKSRRRIDDVEERPRRSIGRIGPVLVLADRDRTRRLGVLIDHALDVLEQELDLVQGRLVLSEPRLGHPTVAVIDRQRIAIVVIGLVEIDLDPIDVGHRRNTNTIDPRAGRAVHQDRTRAPARLAQRHRIITRIRRHRLDRHRPNRTVIAA